MATKIPGDSSRPGFAYCAAPQDLAAAYVAAGHELHRAGQLDQAAKLYQAALTLSPGLPDACLLMGALERQRGQPQQALRWLSESAKARPQHADTQLQLAAAWMESGRLSDASRVLEELLRLAPDHGEALGLHGVILKNLGRFDLAEDSLRKATRVQPAVAAHWSNLAASLIGAGRPVEALEAATQALRISPSHPQALNNLGLAQLELGKIQLAESSFRTALRAMPDYAEAHANLGHLLLSTLRLAEGWQEYEWRMLSPRFTTQPPKTVKPRWNGSATCARVLLWPEQGIGEQILHCTMLAQVANLAPNAIVALDKRLVTSIRRAFPQLTVVEHVECPEPSSYDLHLPLGSLGRLTRVSLDHFPKSPRRLVGSRDTRFVSWEPAGAAIQALGLTIGISWCSPLSKFRASKDIPLATMLKSAALPGAQLINLQYGDIGAEAEAAMQASGVWMHTVPGLDRMNDIDGLLDVLERCDVIVTGCNTLAHLAGAAARPTVVLAPAAQGLLWCWHDLNGTSPWYPSTRIIRQAETGRWDDELASCRAILVDLANKFVHRKNHAS